MKNNLIKTGIILVTFFIVTVAFVMNIVQSDEGLNKTMQSDEGLNKTTIPVKPCPVLTYHYPQEINETLNNSTIRVKQGDVILLRLNDFSRTGMEWSIHGDNGLEISDQGVTWYQEEGTPPVSLIEYGIHEWNVTPRTSGKQNLTADLHFLSRMNNSPLRIFNLTIISN